MHKACMMTIHHILTLIAANNNFISVDNHYIVTHILVWSISSLVLSAENRSNSSSHTTERLISCVHDVPIAFLCAFVYENSFHR